MMLLIGMNPTYLEMTVTSDEIGKRRGAGSLRMLAIFWGGYLFSLSSAFGQIEAWEASLLEDGTLLAICKDEKFLSLGSLTFDSCISEARKHSSQCWAHLSSVVVAEEDVSTSTVGRRSKEQTSDVVWLFVRCIQSSILLPHLAPPGETLVQDTDSRRNNEPELADWTAATKKSVLIYDDIRQALLTIEKRLSDSEYQRVSKIGRGEVTATLRENNVVTSVQPDSPERWAELLNASRLESAQRARTEYHFDYAPVMSTSEHTFDFIFVHSPISTLKECRPEFVELNCGSCDVHVEEGVVARMTWHSNEVLRDTGDIDISNIDAINLEDVANSKIVECWFEGMEQLGYDRSAMEPWKLTD